MKKWISIIPSIGAIFAVLLGVFDSGMGPVKESLLVSLGMTFLGLYHFFSIFIYGLALAVKGEHKLNRSNKLWFLYFVGILCLDIGTALFLMTHH